MSQSRDDDIANIVYMKMLQWSEPYYVSDICDRVPGLKWKRDIVTQHLNMMCANGLAVNVNGKYILTEKMTPDPVEKDSSLTTDGPAYGTTCSSLQRTGEVRTEAVNIQAEASVPVQQSVARGTTSSLSTIDNKEVQLYTGALDRIISCLKSCPGAMKAKDIAQKTGLGQSRSDVNRYLYFLKEKQAIEMIGKAEWKFVQDVSTDDLKMYAAMIAKKHGGNSKLALPGPSSGNCNCPNAGPGCVHVTNHTYVQHNHINNYNVQIGEHNRMLPDTPPDDRSANGSQ